MYKKIKFIALIGLVVIFNHLGTLSAAQIDVYCNYELGEVNKKVFGNNLIGYDPTTYENWVKGYYGYSDFGAGIWDSRKKESVKEVVDLAKDSGMSVARFPGGCGAHHYDWKKSIGKDRKFFLYGLDEFLRTCEEIGAEPVITVSYFVGDEQDAADLVEYLNTPAGQKYRWADMRAQNGHSEPYRVKYFEIGNEDWHGDHRKVKKVFPEEYAHKYLKYYVKMKSVDSSVKVGAVFYTEEWNKKILGIIRNRIDFGIVHTYPHPDVDRERLKLMKSEDIFKESLGLALLKEENNLSNASKLIKEKLSKNLALAITEYNGGISGNDPVPYRHCLGTALLNAELLRVFMKPEHNILMANYWDFVNEYWGMIANGFDGTDKTLYNKYYKRPNYYVFELYRKYFGSQLISVRVDSDTYSLNGLNFPYLTVNASKNSDGKNVFLMIVNKNMENSVTAAVKLNNFNPSLKAKAAVLNGPSIDATNEASHDDVKVREFTFDIKEDSFLFTFEPHSLTAIEIGSK